MVSYNYNMVAIVNHRPMTLGIVEILDAYIKHQKEVITKRTSFDLSVAQKRLHIVDGLIKAFSILDDVIKTIRASKDRSDANINLINKFGFTEEQSKAILDLQLYRLSNMDVVALEEEQKKLQLIIKSLTDILASDDRLKSVMKEELKLIKKEYATPRKSEIKDEITEIKIDTTKMIPKDDVIVVVTNEGYIKRVSYRSYNSNEDNTLLKEGDFVRGLYKMNTLDTLILFTDLGNYLYIPVYDIPDLKWKELGKHVSNIIKIDPEENIIYSLPVYNFDDTIITMVSKDGMIKRTKLSYFKVQRYNKPLTAMKLKNNDLLVSVDNSNNKEIFIVTKNGIGLRYLIDEVSLIGIKGSGVKAINLKNDEVIKACLFNETDEFITIITRKNTGKRVRINEFDRLTRAKKGVQIIRDVKTNPYYILNVFIENKKFNIVLKTDDEFKTIKSSELPIMDRYSTGSTITKKNIDACFEEAILLDEKTSKEEVVEKKEEISLNQVDEKILTIDDFLDDFKINGLDQ